MAWTAFRMRISARCRKASGSVQAGGNGFVDLARQPDSSRGAFLLEVANRVAQQLGRPASPQPARGWAADEHQVAEDAMSATRLVES